MKKNNRTNNPTLLVSAQFAYSKPKNKTKKIKNKIYSIMYTEFLFFSLCWVVKKEKTALLFESSLFILSKNLKLGRIPKILQVEIQRKGKAQPIVLCRDLKLMSRHGILLMAHYQSLPLPFKLQPVYLSTALISGRDIEVMS